MWLNCIARPPSKDYGATPIIQFLANLLQSDLRDPLQLHKWAEKTLCVKIFRLTYISPL